MSCPRKAIFYRGLYAALLAGFLLWGNAAAAQTDALATVPAGSGQPALEVVIRGGRILVANCQNGKCDWSGATKLEPPAELAALLPQLTGRPVKLRQGRQALLLRIPHATRPWEAVVVGVAGKAPGVVFAARTGMTADAAGELYGKKLVVEQRADGTVDVLVGVERQDVSLCGRPTLLSPKVLSPKDLSLHRVKMQRLAKSERQGAPTLQATATAAQSAGSGPLLTALAASSAVGSPGYLTDGDAKTAWAEKRSGTGTGEFVVLRAPSELAIHGFRFTPQAEQGSAPPRPGTSLGVPKSFFIATDGSLFRVELPEDAALPGAQFEVLLPAPLQTKCVAVVLEKGAVAPNALPTPDQTGQAVTPADAGQGTSHQAGKEPGSQIAAVPKKLDVALAEFDALISLDPERLKAALGRLDAPGDKETDSAIALMIAAGPALVDSLSARYPQLSPVGRSRVLHILDQLTCTASAAGYAAAVTGEHSSEQDAALKRLTLCAQPGIQAVVAAVPQSSERALEELSHWLAHTDAQTAVSTLAPLLQSTKRARRRVLRRALAIAGVKPEAAVTIRMFLNGKNKLRRKASIDLMRALGPQLTRFEDVAAPRISRLLAKRPSYRTRYLLLGPASVLAPTNPQLAAWLGQVQKSDPKLPVRAEATRVLPTVQKTELLSALQDSEVRVREAAVLNLGQKRLAGTEAALIERLDEDPWPLVRSAAVKALSSLEPSPAIHRALTEALEEDESADVRRPTAIALGQNNAPGAASALRERLEDSEEDTHVRAASASALGQLCDTTSTDLLAEYASILMTMHGSQNQNIIGRAALNALGRLNPPDLKRRLQGFQGKDVPVWAARAAIASQAHPDPCRR